MLTFKSDDLAEKVAQETGSKPSYSFHAFDNLEKDVARGIKKIKDDPHVVHKNNIRGFIFDVASGKLNEVK
jgi:carbonic anhydrase